MKKLILALSVGLLVHNMAHAQFTHSDKKSVIDSAAFYLNRYYVFPDMATKAADQLRRELAQHAYDSIRTGEAFAQALTARLQKITADKHLRVEYSATVQPVQTVGPLEMEPADRKGYEQWLLSENYGITSVKVLPGNIGYIDFKWFCDPEIAGDTYSALMNYISHTDALIIDLRQSQGAMSTEVIPFICSYFFKSSTHLNDHYWREGNRTVQTWTQEVVPGKKYLDKPVYILTSGKTFSGAEELAYNLKNLKRATLVGEVTGGGANGGGTVRISDHFNMFIPLGRAINPITHTNWEGVGVQPDTAVKANRALYKAQLMALEYLNEKFKADTNWKGYLQDQLDKHRSSIPKFSAHTFILNGYAGAKEVYVAGSFNSWSPVSNKMIFRDGRWEAIVEAEPGTHSYKFVVDGQWITDPQNPDKITEGGYDNSVVEIK